MSLYDLWQFENLVYFLFGDAIGDIMIKGHVTCPKTPHNY